MKKRESRRRLLRMFPSETIETASAHWLSLTALRREYAHRHGTTTVPPRTPVKRSARNERGARSLSKPADFA